MKTILQTAKTINSGKPPVSAMRRAESTPNPKAAWLLPAGESDPQTATPRQNMITQRIHRPAFPAGIPQGSPGRMMSDSLPAGTMQLP